MRTITVQSTINTFKDETELSEDNYGLLMRAKEAAKSAYAPYSNFKVGAAILLENGAFVIGSNQENAAYPVTMCGERTAIFAAAAQYPNIPIKKIAITIISAQENITRPVPPCGSCRQAIYEFELRYKRDIILILQGDKGEVYEVQSIKDLLPLLFDSSYLTD